VLIVKEKKLNEGLHAERGILGNVMGNLEAWLLLRSLRFISPFNYSTLKLRVMHQSKSAAEIAFWLVTDELCRKVISNVHHASLPTTIGHESAKRQGDGWSGVLSITVCF
jgi:cystathionine gamma-synthase